MNNSPQLPQPNYSSQPAREGTRHRDDFRREITRLQHANAVMRSANKALANGNDRALLEMGFSLAHVDKLQRNGGFPPTSIGNNTRMIAYLKSIADSQKS